MSALTQQVSAAGLADHIFSERQLGELLGGGDARRYGLVNRALKDGSLIRLKRGIYVLGRQYRSQLVHPFAVAQSLIPGSYISFESALAYHGWIPEAVFLTASVGELGYLGTAPGHFDAAFSATTMPNPIYASFRSGDRLANDSHYHHCNHLGRPMMMVKIARTYAELEWDCITVDSSEEAHLHGDRSRELVSIMFNLFQARAKGAPGKPIFLGSAFTGTIEKLLPATARQLAEDYFRLLYSPLVELQAPQNAG